MKIKTYRSDSVPKALAKIKKELGESAVILKTKRLRTRRLLGLIPSLAYEITAASESPPQTEEKRSLRRRRKVEAYETAPSADAASRRRKPSTQTASRRDEKPSRGVPEAQAASLVQRLSAEIENLQRVVARQSAVTTARLSLAGAAGGTSDSEGTFSRTAAYELGRLVHSGLDEDFASSLVRYAQSQVDSSELDSAKALRRSLRQALESMIETTPIPVDGGRRCALFLGPTGVGKTTTIAKLAALFALGEGLKVQLITLDTYRIAAAEQLKIYADIIGVPVTVASDIAELEKALEQSGDRDRILIDTSGHSHQGLQRLQPLADFLKGHSEIERHLVLSAASKPEDLKRIIAGFGAFEPDRLVFTKLDETSSYGAVAGETILSGIPLSYLTDGQAVPDDLKIPDPRMVAELAAPETGE